MIVSFYEDHNLSDLPSIFLAGPTIRNGKFEDSWRYKAVELFEKLGFNGNIYVPESITGNYSTDIKQTVQWEWDRLESSKKIMFWIPRDLETLPGFTTNIEFGRYITLCPNDVILGFPIGAPKTKYIELLYNRFSSHTIPHTLENTVATVYNLM